MSIGSIFASLASLVIPVECALCSKPDEVLCGPCRANLLCSPLHQRTPFTSSERQISIVSQLRFNESISSVILGAKDNANLIFQSLIIDSLIKARSRFPCNLVLVPIPTTTRARRKRGRDFMLEITQALAHVTGDTVLPFLNCVGKVSPQKSLNANERSKNLTNAFAINPKVARENFQKLSANQILLVDDVVTTGATMLEGFRALDAWGAQYLGGISAAYSLNWSMGHPSH